MFEFLIKNEFLRDSKDNNDDDADDEQYQEKQDVSLVFFKKFLRPIETK